MTASTSSIKTASGAGTCTNLVGQLAYYPGCSLHSTAAEFSLSTQAICAALGVDLTELEDWNCCGASSGHALDPFLAHALPLRNLILAQREGRDVLAPCAACYHALRSAQQAVGGGGGGGGGGGDSHPGLDHRLQAEMQTVMGETYRGETRVYHIIDLLAQPEIKDLLSRRVVRPLGGLPVVAYYGCLLTRPPRVVSFEANPEQPQLMDAILKTLGAHPLPWTHKTECCGASLAISNPHLVEELVGRIVAAARRAGAHAIVTACPLCQSNLDSRQNQAQGPGPDSGLGWSQALPVFYITELVGLALGLPGGGWWKKHLVNVEGLVTKAIEAREGGWAGSV